MPSCELPRLQSGWKTSALQWTSMMHSFGERSQFAHPGTDYFWRTKFRNSRSQHFWVFQGRKLRYISSFELALSMPSKRTYLSKPRSVSRAMSEGGVSCVSPGWYLVVEDSESGYSWSGRNSGLIMNRKSLESLIYFFLELLYFRKTEVKVLDIARMLRD